jgi:hypothetical protein
MYEDETLYASFPPAKAVRETDQRFVRNTPLYLPYSRHELPSLFFHFTLFSVVPILSFMDLHVHFNLPKKNTRKTNMSSIYHSVQRKEDEESLLSTKMNMQSQVGGSKGWTSMDDTSNDTRTERKTFISTITSYRWLIDTSLLLIIIGLMTVLLRRDRWNGTSKEAATWQIGGDFTAARLNSQPLILFLGTMLISAVPTKIEKFDPDMSFVPMNSTAFFSPSTLSRWNGIMPVGTGFPGPGKIFSTTSMTHQLHCIYMMARIFSGVTSGRIQDIPEDYNFHFMHCVDYVRQGIMCSADLAVEVHEPKDSDDFGPQDGGWSGHHVCKDYSKVISYLEGKNGTD